MARPVDDPPATDQGLAPPTEDARETPDAAVERLRRELWALHARRRGAGRAGEEPPPDPDELFAQTDRLLEMEARARDRYEQRALRASSRVLYAAMTLLAAAAVLSGLLGLALGWLSGWGVALTAVVLVIALLTAAVHSVARPEDHEARAVFGIAAAVLGGGLLALAPGGLPWWVTAIVWVLFLLVVGASLATAQVGDGDDGG